MQSRSKTTFNWLLVYFNVHQKPIKRDFRSGNELVMRVETITKICNLVFAQVVEKASDGKKTSRFQFFFLVLIQSQFEGAVASMFA